MPIHAGEDKDGPFYQWGDQKKYHYRPSDKESKRRAYLKAKEQATAIYSSGYKGTSKMKTMNTKIGDGKKLRIKNVKILKKDGFYEGNYIKLNEPAEWAGAGQPSMKLPSGSILELRKRYPGGFMARTKEGKVFFVYDKFLKSATFADEIKKEDGVFEDPYKMILEIRTVVRAKQAEARKAFDITTTPDTKIKAANFVKWLDKVENMLREIQARF